MCKYKQIRNYNLGWAEKVPLLILIVLHLYLILFNKHKKK